MKRSKIMILSLAVAVMLMAGCSNKDEANSSVTIVSETTVESVAESTETSVTEATTATTTTAATESSTTESTTLVNNDFKEPEEADIVVADDGDSYVKDQILICAVPGTTYDDIVKLGEKFDFTVVGYSDDDYQVEFNKSMSYDDLSDAVDELCKEDIVSDCFLNGVYDVSVD